MQIAEHIDRPGGADSRAWKTADAGVHEPPIPGQMNHEAHEVRRSQVFQGLVFVLFAPFVVNPIAARASTIGFTGNDWRASHSNGR